MTEEIGVGVVGLGYASQTFHLPLIEATPGLALHALCTRDPAKRGERWRTVTAVATPEALCARDDVALVVIATPNDTHFQCAMMALDAGKHVVVDKPFTLTALEAETLVQRAGDVGRVLSVFHNRRWDGDFRTVQELLARQALGRLTHFESHFDRFRPGVRARWRESAVPGAGLWYDLGPHLLDQALCLFGNPESIQLDLARQRDGAQADDWFHAVLRYGPLRAVLHASALVAGGGPRFVLHGTRGSFTKFGLDPQEEALKAGLPPVGAAWGCDPEPGRLVCAAADGQLTTEVVPGLPGDYPAYYAALRDAIAAGRPNPVPAQEAWRVMQWLERGLESAAQGCRVGAGA